MKRCIVCVALIFALVMPVGAEPIRWVDFGVPYESLKYALDQDIATFDQEKHIGWIESLSLAACRTGGKCGLASVKKAVADLKGDKSPEELLGIFQNITTIITRRIPLPWAALWAASPLRSTGSSALPTD